MSDKNKVQDAIDSKFIEQRKVFLWGQVDDKSAKHVIDRLMYLDALETQDIQLYINSPGGYVQELQLLWDLLYCLQVKKENVLYSHMLVL